MHVHFVGEPDDGMSVSSHHAHALASSGVRVSFDERSDAPGSGAQAADVLHIVTQAQTDFTLLRRLIAARKSGQPIVRWWTGRDVLWATHHQPTRRVAQAIGQLGAIQLAGSEALARDLGRIGVTARTASRLSLRLCSTIEPAPLPSTFTVLTYLPTERRAFHGGAMIDELVHRLPDVRFLILGDHGTDYSVFSNVESLGFIDDVTRAIRRATTSVQPRADGQVSRLALEMLCQGRHVIANATFPCSRAAATVEQYVREIRQIQRENSFNLEGREHVCREYDCPRSLEAFRSVLDECVAPGRLQLKLSGRWQAASVALRNPSLSSKKPFPPLDLSSLPPEAKALRLLVDRAAVSGAGHT